MKKSLDWFSQYCVRGSSDCQIVVWDMFSSMRYGNIGVAFSSKISMFLLHSRYPSFHTEIFCIPVSRVLLFGVLPMLFPFIYTVALDGLDFIVITPVLATSLLVMSNRYPFEKKYMNADIESTNMVDAIGNM